MLMTDKVSIVALWSENGETSRRKGVGLGLGAKLGYWGVSEGLRPVDSFRRALSLPRRCRELLVILPSSTNLSTA